MKILLQTRDECAGVDREVMEEDLTLEEYQDLLAQLRSVLLQFVHIPCSEWVLSGRAMNMLRRHKLMTLWEVKHISAKDIVRLSWCGVKVILEIYSAGKAKGVDLPNWLAAANLQYSRTLYPTDQVKLEKSQPATSEGLL